MHLCQKELSRKINQAPFSQRKITQAGITYNPYKFRETLLNSTISINKNKLIIEQNFSGCGQRMGQEVENNKRKKI
jgi:hypothetical protein